MDQPTFFDRSDTTVSSEHLTLFALGDFQSRGKLLAERELALDRLLGAFRRAAEIFEVAYLSDKEIVASLRGLGVRVLEVPAFVAKHPFRILVPVEIAGRASTFYRDKKVEIKGPGNQSLPG
jgi:hypothetical protein